MWMADYAATVLFLKMPRLMWYGRLLKKTAVGVQALEVVVKSIVEWQEEAEKDVIIVNCLESMPKTVKGGNRVGHLEQRNAKRDYIYGKWNPV